MEKLSRVASGLVSETEAEAWRDEICTPYTPDDEEEG